MFTFLRRPTGAYVILSSVILSFQVAIYSYRSLPRVTQPTASLRDSQQCPGGAPHLQGSGLSIALYRKALAHALQILQARKEEYNDCILPGVDEQISAAVWVQARRWLRITVVCEYFHPAAPLFPYKWVRVADNINVGFCTNYKAGTTTWLRYLLEWSGVKVDENTTHTIHRISNKAFNWILWDTERGEELLKERHPFMFFSVRHPYERLVSFYKNRLLTDDPLFHKFKVIAEYVVGEGDLQEALDSNFPLDTADLDGRVTNISFPQFIRFVLRQYLPCEGDGPCLEKVGDPHYSPTYIGCAPCFTDYDFISKVETLKEDVQIVQQIVLSERRAREAASGDTEHESIRTLNPPPVGRVLPQELRLNPSGDSSGIRDSTSLYMSLLTPKEVKHLKEIYRFDFLLFNYDPDDYL